MAVRPWRSRRHSGSRRAPCGTGSAAGATCQQVHQHRVLPQELGQVQADELRVKLQGQRVWLAMALAVPAASGWARWSARAGTARCCGGWSAGAGLVAAGAPAAGGGWPGRLRRRLPPGAAFAGAGGSGGAATADPLGRGGDRAGGEAMAARSNGGGRAPPGAGQRRAVAEPVDQTQGAGCSTPPSSSG